MLQSGIFYITNLSFDVIIENIIIAKNSDGPQGGWGGKALQ